MFARSLGSQGHAGRADCDIVLLVDGSQVMFENSRIPRSTLPKQPTSVYHTAG